MGHQVSSENHEVSQEIPENGSTEAVLGKELFSYRTKKKSQCG